MIPRRLAVSVLQALADTPVVLVAGARQTGKSTLVQSDEVVGAARQFLTFDDPGVLAAAKRDPNGFVAGLSAPVTLDEIQHVPELFPVIKAAVDKRRQPGRFLLTGSANVMLLPKLSESLAGRMEILTLWPFSQVELRRTAGGLLDKLFAGDLRLSKPPALAREDLIEFIVAGGYPPALARPSTARREAWFESYVTTALQRDVRDLSNIADITAVPALLSVVAARAGNLLNFADLSRTIGLSQSTLKRYFALLQGTYLVQLLRPWAGNLGSRIIQTPKVYLNDSGLLAHLLGVGVDRLRSEANPVGAILENFVLMELRKQRAWSSARPELFYWRTASGQEVDIVLEDRAGRIVGIEVKAASTLGTHDLRGLQALGAAAGKKWIRGIVLYTGATVIPFSANMHGVPVSLLWSA